jgi:hypothetical protein
MDIKPKRPLSVWIAQILLVIVAVIYCLPLAMNYDLLSKRNLPTSYMLTAAALFMFNLLISSLAIASFYGMAKRMRFGRWLGVGLFCLFVIVAAVSALTSPASYSNSTQKAAGTVTQLYIEGLLIGLILNLVLSKKVASFFSRSSLGVADVPPPPPASFED